MTLRVFLCMHAQQQICACVLGRTVTRVHFPSRGEMEDVFLAGRWADLRWKGLNRKGTKAGEPEGEGEWMSRRDDNVA